MANLDELISERNDLRKIESTVIEKVWNNSAIAIDHDGEELTAANIQNRIDDLADQIIIDSKGDTPVIVGVLDGATPVAEALCAALKRKNHPYIYSPMSAKSYGKGTEGGALTIGALPGEKLYGQKVFIVDDVCDKGDTLKAIHELLATQKPNLIKTVALVEKDLVKGKKREKCYYSDYAGFRMDKSSFIIGYGLDFRNYLRNKDQIRIANLEVLTDEDKKLFDSIDNLEKLIEMQLAKQATPANTDTGIVKMEAPAISIFDANCAVTSTTSVVKAEMSLNG